MTETSYEYNPRLIIVDHFDKIRNELDIIVETLFDQNRQLIKKEKNEINAIREKQIKEIEEIRESHISKWPENFDKQQHQLEWQHLFDDETLTSKQKIERIKEGIIERDAILMHDKYLITKTCL